MRDLDAAWEEIGPWLAERESRRGAALKRFWTGGGLAVGGAFVLGAALFALGLPTTLAVIAAVLLAAGVMAWAAAPLQALRREVKIGMNTRLAAAFDLSYAPKPAWPARFEAFRDHGLVPGFDRRSFEDHFEGETHGARFELYEAHLEEKRRSKNRTYYVTVFRGALIRIAFPRTVEGVTLVTRDKGVFNAFESFFKKTFKSRSLDRIGLVDPTFEDKFEVYGTDQVMARYLLTPSFMERLLALEETLEGENVRCVFDEALGDGDGVGELLIAAETGDRFEAGSMFARLDRRERVERLHREIRLIDEIVQTLLEPAKFEDA